MRKQTGDLSQMIWDVPHQIEFLSTLFELKPGDLIFTGTPAGVSAIKKGDKLKGSRAGAWAIKKKNLKKKKKRLGGRGGGGCGTSVWLRGSHDPA